jgi:Protein of unknown function (DUF2585)
LSRPAAILIVAIVALAAAVESQMGRPLTYRHGPVRLWSGNVQSDQNSQQIADPYTFTHFEHGALFYGLTWLVMRGASLGSRAVTAVAIEAAWEAYENTDAVIERYRTETISLGYYGDSIINSLADIAACLIGFFLAWRLPTRMTVAWIVAIEVILAFWIRDNLFLNILMLVRPLDAVRQWQMSAAHVLRAEVIARCRV